MFLQRSAVAVARRAAVAPVVRRSFATTVIRRELRHGGCFCAVLSTAGKLAG